MTTFRTSEKTHQVVLPQRPALEPVAADNPGSRDETGYGLPASQLGAGAAEHGRGEISESGTRSRKRHPDPAVAGKGAFSAGDGSTKSAGPVLVGAGAALVPVLDKRGAPLMPCHPARARELLAKGRAVVVRHTPFVIRLKDRVLADSVVAGVQIRIDPGSKGTGIAVTGDTGCSGEIAREGTAVRRGLLAVEVRHRGAAIRASLAQRANYRRRRRSRNLRYRSPRFSNRTRPKGWLAPSLLHRVDTTMSMVGRLIGILPVTGIEVEQVSFDTHALSLGKEAMEGGEYQRGTLAGYEARQYLLEKWGRACVYCGAEGVPLQVEHIRSRLRGGSDRISNLTLACEPCNQRKGARPIGDFVADRPALLARIVQQAKAPLRDAAAVNATRHQLFGRLKSLKVPVKGWSGGRTKYNRSTHLLAKSHTLDALAVGEVAPGVRIVRHPDTVLVAQAAGRGSYARTTPDRHGFRRLIRPRAKQFHGYATGDLVRAAVPVGKKAGTYTGRVAVRATGNFNITTAAGRVQGISHRYCRLLQRADGYGYSTRKETAHMSLTTAARTGQFRSPRSTRGILPVAKDGVSARDIR